ncbi:MAG: hypothetical protein Q9170_005831 [Blastenia crenularia]
MSIEVATHDTEGTIIQSYKSTHFKYQFHLSPEYASTCQEPYERELHRFLLEGFRLAELISSLKLQAEQILPDNGMHEVRQQELMSLLGILDAMYDELEAIRKALGVGIDKMLLGYLNLGLWID